MIISLCTSVYIRLLSNTYLILLYIMYYQFISHHKIIDLLYQQHEAHILEIVRGQIISLVGYFSLLSCILHVFVAGIIYGI